MSKVARNLQEQVAKNMEDIELLKQYKGYLGPFDSVEDIPEEAKSQYWLYLVGDEAPYELYKFDGTNFVDLGEYPKAGPAGRDGTDGTSAGFGTPTAQASALNPNQAPTVSITATGSNEEKIFNFTFGIPKGEAGPMGPSGNDPSVYLHKVCIVGSKFMLYVDLATTNYQEITTLATLQTLLTNVNGTTYGCCVTFIDTDDDYAAYTFSRFDINTYYERFTLFGICAVNRGAGLMFSPATYVFPFTDVTEIKDTVYPPMP